MQPTKLILGFGSIMSLWMLYAATDPINATIALVSSGIFIGSLSVEMTHGKKKRKTKKV